MSALADKSDKEVRNGLETMTGDRNPVQKTLNSLCES